MNQNADTGNRGLTTLQAAALAAAALLFLLIATDDFMHRIGSPQRETEWLVAPTALLILAAAASAWRSFRRARWISRPLMLSLAALSVQVLLFGFRIYAGESLGAIAAYLSSTMIVHALVLTATVVAFRYRIEARPTVAFETPFARLTLWLVGFVFLSLVSGSYVTLSGSPGICRSWPLCGPDFLPADPYAWIALGHRLTVGFGGLLMLRATWAGWTTQRYQTSTLVMLTTAALLFFAQALIGAVMSVREPDLILIGLHVASGAATWAAVIVLAVHVGLQGRTAESERLDSFGAGTFRERLKDFFSLTKPIIVLLLLATTTAGMVVGARGWPPLPIMLWTLLGGALAAGGSGAINQYIDRNVDAKMKRTARRPIAARRLTPAEGLAFGVGLCLLSFYLLAVFVNMLAAVLSVAGMFYYVWLYSIVLKKSTVQNIVIGGGAGSIPPLVGWAAATGGLTFPALLLFVIIFFWTPPHFWALALVRAKDYERGGIPMLPVVRGEKETRRQILIYTFVLVGITLLAPLVDLAGVIYLVGAVVLGALLILYAWRLNRAFSVRQAWRMYRYSSLYLLFLFVLMMVDALV